MSIVRENGVMSRICFGVRGQRRIGRHRYAQIGRTMMYGKRVIRIVACIHCDRTSLRG